MNLGSMPWGDNSGGAAFSSWTNDLLFGNWWGSQWRSYLQFDPSAFAGKQITQATLRVQISQCDNQSYPSVPYANAIGAHRLTSSYWFGQGWPGPSWSGDAWGSVPGPNSVASIDVTTIAQQWATNPGSNMGLMLDLGSGAGYCRAKRTATNGQVTAIDLQYGTPPAVGVGKGMIIPAYFALGDTTSWANVAQGAAYMQSGSNPAYRDYWVTVNGGSGPFSAAEWGTAAARFNPIRANGGKIFGYVHTHQNAYSPNPALAAQFRPLSAVQADIAAWVAGYPSLDGIWIDEYYPRHELATDGVRFADFPNGLAAAPPAYRTPGLDLYSTGQLTPGDGWYDTLFQWIRATYPNRRIIANAGGALYSNQLLYGPQADVLVSFEQTLAEAQANNWSRLITSRNPYAAKQLALIHGNTTDLAGALNQAFNNGYTHVYTTSQVFGQNLWTGVPPYFYTEVQSMASRP